jgi:hypothetical protein
MHAQIIEGICGFTNFNNRRIRFNDLKFIDLKSKPFSVNLRFYMKDGMRIEEYFCGNSAKFFGT